MLARAATGAINHLLAQAQWARDTLRPFAGRCVRFQVAPAAFTLTLTGDGFVAEADEAAPGDLSISLSPITALRLGAGDESARADVLVQGDDDLTRAIWHVVNHLRWDAEEDLSRVFGDIAAHRIAGTAKQAVAAGRDSVERAGLAVAEYLSEESGLTPPRLQLEAFAQDVDRARELADRLEARIRQLEQRQGRGD